MSQERLSALSILCIEKDKQTQINFDKLLYNFGMTKARITVFDSCNLFLKTEFFQLQYNITQNFLIIF